MAKKKVSRKKEVNLLEVKVKKYAEVEYKNMAIKLNKPVKYLRVGALEVRDLEPAFYDMPRPLAERLIASGMAEKI